MATPMITESLDARPDESRGQPESMAALLRRLMNELSTLFRQELQLAGVELTGALTKFVAGLASVAAGAAVLYAGLLVLLASAVLGLAQVMDAWLAALIVGAVPVVVGLIMVFAGMKAVDPSAVKPKRTIRSLNQDKDTLARKET